MHEETFQRPRLEKLVNNIYVPKLKVKSFASYVYSGETKENYNNYEVNTNGPNKIFSKKDRSRDEFILGIESSFDESAASIVNSYGEVKSNH